MVQYAARMDACYVYRCTVYVCITRVFFSLTIYFGFVCPLNLFFPPYCFFFLFLVLTLMATQIQYYSPLFFSSVLHCIASECARVFRLIEITCYESLCNAHLAAPLRTETVKVAAIRMVITQLTHYAMYTFIQYAMNTRELIIVCTTKERNYICICIRVYFEKKRIAMQRVIILRLI